MRFNRRVIRHEYPLRRGRRAITAADLLKEKFSRGLDFMKALDGISGLEEKYGAETWEKYLHEIIRFFVSAAEPGKAYIYFKRLKEKFPDGEYVKEMEAAGDDKALAAWAEAYRIIDDMDIAAAEKLEKKAALFGYDAEDNLPDFSFFRVYEDGYSERSSVGELLKTLLFELYPDSPQAERIYRARQLNTDFGDCGPCCITPEDLKKGFENFKKKYPKGGLIPDAMMKLADYYVECAGDYFGGDMNDEDRAMKEGYLKEAKKLYQEIAGKYPGTENAKKAAQRAGEVEKSLREFSAGGKK